MQNAMSMPGDRDAQRMLLGEEPLSRMRPLRPPNSLPGRRAPAPPRRSDSMPMPSNMERKVDPGIGAPSSPPLHTMRSTPLSCEHLRSCWCLCCRLLHGMDRCMHLPPFM